MTNYYHILKIPQNASKQRTFIAFKKRYLQEKQEDIKIDLLTGFLLIVNERQKFLDILLKQQKRGKPLTPKYFRLISSERKRAETMITNTSKKKQLESALKSYPFKEAASGLLFLFLYGADRYYFEISYLLMLIGTILVFQLEQGLHWVFFGLALLLAGIYTHVKIVRDVKINKIKKTAISNHLGLQAK